ESPKTPGRWRLESGRAARPVRRHEPDCCGGKSLAPLVGDAIPAWLGRALDRLAAAVGRDVDERGGVLVERDVQLALLDALVQPRAAEDQPAQPVHERALG